MMNEQNLSVEILDKGTEDLERCLYESPLLDLWEAVLPVDTTAVTNSSSNNNDNDHLEFNVDTNQDASWSHALPCADNGCGLTTLNSSSSSMTSDDDGSILTWSHTYNHHHENPSVALGRPTSSWFPDSFLDIKSFQHDMMFHREKKRLKVNDAGAAVAPHQTAAALQENVPFLNIATDPDDNDRQANSHQALSLPVVEDAFEAVYFGWIKHPQTILWRSIVKEFSDDHTGYTAWSESICDQVKERLQKEGCTTFWVCKRDGNKIFDGTQCRGTWRKATKKEVLERTRQRFLDDRKRPPQSSPTKQCRGRPPTKRLVNVQQAAATAASSNPDLPPRWTDLTAISENVPPSEDKQENVALNMTVFNRKPWDPITKREVCFGWNTHPGTTRWREVVESFSANSQDFPTWTDGIARLVKKLLNKEGIHHFLVFLNSKGEPCLNICDGLWYRATADEVLENTKVQFLSGQKQLEEEVCHAPAA